MEIVVFRGFAKGVGFPKGGFGGCSPVPTTGTEVHSDVPRYQKPERSYIRMFPGTKTGTRAHSPKPPFYETALLFPLECLAWAPPDLCLPRCHCVSARPLVPREGLSQIHGQSLNTHRGKHRSGGALSLATAVVFYWEPVDPVAADPVRQDNDKRNNIQIYTEIPY